MALAVAVAMSAAAPAAAQQVTYRFEGVVTGVGSELAGDVSVGDSFKMDATWNIRSEPVVETAPTFALYQPGILAWKATIGRRYRFRLVDTTGVIQMYVFNNLTTPDILGMYMELSTSHFAGPVFGTGLGLWYLESQIQYPGWTWGRTDLPWFLPWIPSSATGRLYYAEPGSSPETNFNRRVEFKIRKVMPVLNRSMLRFLSH